MNRTLATDVLHMSTFKDRLRNERGFTLIELLVVVLIIGILAAIAIPSFLNQKGKANDANVKSDINTAQTAEETYYTDGQAYTAATTDLTNIESTLSSAVAAPESLALAVTGMSKAMPPTRMALNDSVRTFTPAAVSDTSMPLAFQNRLSWRTNAS